MADWRITAYLGADGRRFTDAGGGMWQGPNGEAYATLDGLTKARGPLTPADVDGLPDLVAELALTAEAADRLHAALYDAGQRERAARHALRLARRALTGLPRRCHLHGDDLKPGRSCCAPPRDVVRALNAVDAATRQPMPTAPG